MEEYAPIILASSISEDYAPGLAVTIRSLLDHYRGERPIEWYVLETDLQAETREKLLRSAADHRLTITFLRPDTTAIDSLPLTGNVHPAMYYYLLLPDLLPQHNKVLLLDADMLVLNDIEELWNTDVAEVPMAAAQELRSPYVSSTYGLITYAELGIAPDTKFCNAGMMLINLLQWRREGIAQQIIDYTLRYKDRVRFWDQDGVNAVLAGRWKELDPAWNVTTESELPADWQPDDPAVVRRVSEAPRIVHFVMHKPWNDGCPHPRAPLFQHYLRRTAWGSDTVPAPKNDPYEATVPLGWFSAHAKRWDHLLSPYKGKPDLHFLEVGSWTGSSACWMLEHILTHPTSTLTCVDIFERDYAFEKKAKMSGVRTPEVSDDLDIEADFDANICSIGAESRVWKKKGRSENVLRTLPMQYYHCIYIDGSHIARDVLSDAVLCWPLLRQGGILIFDDYQLRMYRDRIDNPAGAIDAFLAVYYGRYELLHVGWQLIVRKRDHCEHPPLAPGELQNAVDNALPGESERLRARQEQLHRFLSNNL